jgi:aspartyl-tRNA(Asn)/glutamyl-tRNA(Gln) amidotransferase subunit A
VKPSGSIGRQAMADALATLAAHRPEPADRRPATDFAPPRSTAPMAPDRVRVRVPPGPIALAAASLRAGEVTSGGLVDEALLAVDKYDGELNAVAHLLADAARADAAELDAEAAAGRWRGPLHGIPVTVKDVIDVAGAPTRAGSVAYHDVPTADAESVARLRAAGAVIFAKVTTHEFALGVTTPQSRNPHDPSRIPGGSSGGSAIAVSTGMGLGSLGTDTRASIRVPAALSGVVGLKPTYGTVPTRGVVPLSWTMDHVAPMAATVGDAALLLDALRPAFDPVAPWAGAAVAGRRVGVPGAALDGAEPGVLAAFGRALAALRQLGCVLGDLARPNAEDLDVANAAGLVVSRCEAAAFHRGRGTTLSRCWDEVADQLDAAAEVSAVEYLDAQRVRAQLAEDLLAAFADHDVLVMPTVPIVAPPVEDFARHLLLLSRNAIPWSFTGFPALSVPCGWSQGLPVGLQVVAPPGREDLVVAVGAALEGEGLGAPEGRGQRRGVVELSEMADIGEDDR